VPPPAAITRHTSFLGFFEKESHGRRHGHLQAGARSIAPCQCPLCPGKAAEAAVIGRGQRNTQATSVSPMEPPIFRTWPVGGTLLFPAEHPPRREHCATGTRPILRSSGSQMSPTGGFLTRQAVFISQNREAGEAAAAASGYGSVRGSPGASYHPEQACPTSIDFTYRV
jgi:hypothetical protein